MLLDALLPGSKPGSKPEPKCGHPAPPPHKDDDCGRGKKHHKKHGHQSKNKKHCG